MSIASFECYGTPYQGRRAGVDGGDRLVISVGDVAPGFVLPGATAEADDPSLYRLEAALSDGPVVVTFYLFDFHPACTRQFCDLHDLDWFDLGLPVTVYGISTDGVYSHREFARDQNIGIPLLSDHDGSVADEYGVLQADVDHHAAVPNRAVFVVDEEQVVRHAWAADDPADQPDWNAVRAVIDEVRTD